MPRKKAPVRSASDSKSRPQKRAKGVGSAKKLSVSKARGPYEDDPEDIAAFEAYERGELNSVPDQKEASAALRRAAVNFKKKKEARVNIRLQTVDLDGLRLKAEEEGIPYQTLIASLVHKYVNGRVVFKDGRA
ncbi:MAG: hypothetical protein AB7E52_05700 [Bdellovibrionales bacterium]